ncbi:hypothetical protein AAFF_G00339990 [Aldrovandia affinis]|uniref:Immunoglobulin V-set domain-containing protein n=1 Tax=Aldrovandia affinis TaxID=143900 RepID=A0AAD7SMI6_9TELE|nr:hypothetical protein AAFF_G00339990 [Aldrovandia affinis]
MHSVYLKKPEESSVEIICGAKEKGRSPIGFYLKRRYPLPETEVIFVDTDGQVTEHCAYSGRIGVRGQLSARLLNVSISRLQGTDAGLYFCQFIYAAHPSDVQVPGNELFLFVDAGALGDGCGCSRYPPLLFTISAAVGLLLLVIIGLGAARCGKACNCESAQFPNPIYEDMTAVKRAVGGAPNQHPDTSHPDPGTRSTRNDRPICVHTHTTNLK